LADAPAPVNIASKPAQLAAFRRTPDPDQYGSTAMTSLMIEFDVNFKRLVNKLSIMFRRMIEMSWLERPLVKTALLTWECPDDLLEYVANLSIQVACVTLHS
jgi:hypothetical protein